MNSTQRLDEFNRENLETNPDALVPVHVSWNEVKYFNIMQGGQSVDETTGLREYSKLGEIVQIPEIQHIFKTMMELYRSGKGVPEDIQEVINMPMKNEETAVEPIATDSDPEFQQMDATGEGKDKILVMMPQSMVHFFDEIQGGEKTDPTMGLQEFGLFDEVVRGVATVGGAFLGGPVGAGIGNMVGRGLTGQKPGMDMLMGGAKMGLAAWGASSVLGSMGGSFGAMGSQAPGAWGMSNVAAKAAPVINGATGAPHVFGQGAAAVAPAAAAASPSLLSGMSSYLPAAGLAGAGLFMSHRGDKKRHKEDLDYYYKDKEEKDKKKRAAFLRSNPTLEHDMLPTYGIPHQPSAELPHGRPYKKGGQVIGIEIKGRGTGQSDDIPKTVPENSWVWDATTVAHAGDGTTNAGQKAIKKFEDILKREKLPKHKDVIETLIKEKPLRKVPCALSNGERVTPPHLVAAAGDGDFDKGSAVLRKMTQELRRHKASKGLDLPPSAHDLTLYYKKAIKGA